VRALLRRRARRPARKDRLDAVKQILRDQQFEVAALAANAVLAHIHDAGAQLVAQQHADRL
jgi:hypothetical protein